jgi:diacylglycerol kinase family enzyme
VDGIHVIVNAASGAGHDDAIVERIRAAFRAAGADVDVTCVAGDAIGDAVRAALARRPRMIVAAGGDGTIRAVAAGLVGGDVPLGVLPLGTLNHFARELGMPLELEAAARALVAGRTARIDVGDVNGRVFVNNASLGIYPEFVRERRAREARGWGRWTAAAAAFGATLKRHPHLRVRLDIDGSAHVCRTAFVCIGNNAYAWEGLSAGERPRLDAGRLAVYCGHRLGRLATLALALRAFLGLLEPEQDFYARATDGELVRMDTPLTVRVRPRALPVVVPPDSARA